MENTDYIQLSIAILSLVITISLAFNFGTIINYRKDHEKLNKKIEEDAKKIEYIEAQWKTIHDDFDQWKYSIEQIEKEIKLSSLKNELENLSNKKDLLNYHAIYWSSQKQFLKSIRARIELISLCITSLNHYKSFVSDVNLQCKCVLGDLEHLKEDESIKKFNLDHRMEGIGNLQETVLYVETLCDKLYVYLSGENQLRIEEDNKSVGNKKKVKKYKEFLKTVTDITKDIIDSCQNVPEMNHIIMINDSKLAKVTRFNNSWDDEDSTITGV